MRIQKYAPAELARANTRWAQMCAIMADSSPRSNKGSQRLHGYKDSKNLGPTLLETHNEMSAATIIHVRNSKNLNLVS
jgi:hypothetical protein